MIPLVIFRNCILLHRFLNMFTKYVKHASAGCFLKRTECYSIYYEYLQFVYPFQSFRCPETSAGQAVWKRLSTLEFPCFAKSSGGVGTFGVRGAGKYRTYRRCHEFEKPVDESIGNMTQKTMALLIKLCLCQNAALLHL